MKGIERSIASMSGKHSHNAGATMIAQEPPRMPYNELMQRFEENREAAESGHPVPHQNDGEEKRVHHLSRSERDGILKEWNDSGVFVSPYSKGVYTYTLKALVQLGVNEVHPLPKIRDAMKAMMEKVDGRNKINDWARFTKKSDAPHAQKPVGKIWVNLRQFIRFGGENPYGWKLKQLGCVVDRFQDDQGVRWARLNTYAFRGFDSLGEATVVDPKYELDLPTSEFSSPTATDPDRVVRLPTFLPVIKKPQWTLGPKV